MAPDRGIRQEAQVTAVMASKRANIGLWAVQILLAALYAFTGFMKLTQPIDVLAQMMGWPGEMPALARFIGAAELAGAVGLILPWATGVMPRLTAYAAVGLALVQVLAIPFHIYRGEFGIVPVNLVLLGLAVLVCRGRTIA
jgi:hypothetical protein